jgi:predicted RNA-binding protein with PIN domain
VSDELGEPLPAAVRSRVVALAAERLSTLTDDQVPPSVRPFRRFTLRRRAQAAAVPLATALEHDPAFRQSVAEELAPDLAEAVRAGSAVPAAPPEEVAAAAYLLRPEGWQTLVANAGEELAERDRLAAGAATVDEVQRLTEQLAALRSQGRLEAERLTAERDAARAEAAAAVRRGRELGARAAQAERALAAASAAPRELDGEPPAGRGIDVSDGPVEDVEADGPSELRRVRARLKAAEEALVAARAAARGERREEQVRLRVLLDAVVGGATGLQRELALPPLDERPVDGLAAAYLSAWPGGAAPAQGRAADDPLLLDALLAVPSTHLLVDGYNVTKAGYGEQPLEAQRSRLLAGAGALAARTGVELTVVFDGAGLEGARAPAGPAPRGVRLLFSRPGETADDVLRALVRAEPRGRPLVVVSSDREVADDVRRDGARPVPSSTLLALLERSSRDRPHRDVGPRS